jgi:hypothetical protein
MVIMMTVPIVGKFIIVIGKLNKKLFNFTDREMNGLTETTIDRNRRRRLREDHEKYELENLEQLRKDFLQTFRMTREDDYER